MCVCLKLLETLGGPSNALLQFQCILSYFLFKLCDSDILTAFILMSLVFLLTFNPRQLEIYFTSIDWGGLPFVSTCTSHKWYNVKQANIVWPCEFIEKEKSFPKSYLHSCKFNRNHILEQQCIKIQSSAMYTFYTSNCPKRKQILHFVYDGEGLMFPFTFFTEVAQTAKEKVSLQFYKCMSLRLKGEMNSFSVGLP